MSGFGIQPGAQQNGPDVEKVFAEQGEAGHQDSIVRTEYSVNTMVEQGVETEKLGYAMANWNRAQAQTKTAAMLTQLGGEIELIMANNDDMALGVYDYYKQHNLKLPLILGINNSPEMNQKIQAGEIYGTVDNGTNDQISYICKLLNDILNKDTAKYHKIWYSKPFAIEK